MKPYRQIDCFLINMKYWKILGLYPVKMSKYYKIYSSGFIAIFVILYTFLPTINLCYIPGQMELFIEELLFYFTEITVVVKALTFVLMKHKILTILDTLESDTFQSDSEVGIKIIVKAKKFIYKYWKIVALVSYTSNLTKFLPFLFHIVFGEDLFLPLCSYSFFTESLRETYIYPLYFYQTIGMHFLMLINVNVDTFLLGLIILIIAQLDILNDKFKKVANVIISEDEATESGNTLIPNYDVYYVQKLNKIIIHFDKVAKFCHLVEEVFMISLFVQFGVASCVICICLFRFTLPASMDYYVFLGSYMFIMTVQILVPSWFGTQVIVKSSNLSIAVYSSDWTSKSQTFKNNMRLLVERLKQPLSITGWKIFPLSLNTFTSIIKTAYSFFTLLRDVQSRDTKNS